MSLTPGQREMALTAPRPEVAPPDASWENGPLALEIPACAGMTKATRDSASRHSLAERESTKKSSR